MSAAAASADTFVATGHCLPLSTEVPLMPVVDALRTIHDVDDGRVVRGRARRAARRSSLGSRWPGLLPELDDHRAIDAAPSEFARQHLFTALETVLGALAERRPLALLLEDLHWADPTTLDLLEHLLGRSAPIAVVGTWRTEDDTTPQSSTDWCARVAALSDVDALPLGPLTREETAEQLALLRVPAPDAARQHPPPQPGATASSPSSSPPTPTTRAGCPHSSPTCSTVGSTGSPSTPGPCSAPSASPSARSRRRSSRPPAHPARGS